MSHAEIKSLWSDRLPTHTASCGFSLGRHRSATPLQTSRLIRKLYFAPSRFVLFWRHYFLEVKTMTQKLFGLFSGTHLTILGALAIIAPSAIYAVPSYTNVAIEDPVTGNRASVDVVRRLTMLDRSDAAVPANYVNILFSSGSGCSFYTVPANKALVITDITMNLEPSTIGTTSFQYLYHGSGDCTHYIGGARTDGSGIVQVPDALGRGAAIPAGSVIGINSGNSTGFGTFHGYLVPANTVPPPGSAEAAAMSGPLKSPPRR